MPGVMHVQVVFDDVTQPSADTAICTFDYELPVTPPGVNDWGAFESLWDDWWTMVDQNISQDIRNTERRYYNVPPGPNPELGDPVHVATAAYDGASTANRLPPQCAIAVTEITAIRRRWGRFYVPGITVTALAATGRITSTAVADFANATHQLYEGLATTSREAVVRRRADGTYQMVSDIQVDDVFDVIRRRRHSVTLLRNKQSISD